MKIRGVLAVIAIFASLLIGSPADARNRATDLFTKDSISQITIKVSTKNAAKLVKDPKAGVKAKFSIANDNGTLDYQDLKVQFHLKGTSTLQQNPNLLTNRPSLRVKFGNNGPLKLPFLGSQKSLTLNSMTQDASKVHEYTAYKLYNAMDIPAPRVGYAHVNLVVGTKTYDKGLFAIIETYDDAFLSRFYQGRTGHLYEPCNHWTDINRAGAASGGPSCNNSVFQVKEGWKSTPNKLDLAAFSKVQKLRNSDEWWQGMDRYTDRDEMVRMWAAENFLSAWDSYSGAIINNYYLRSDSMGVFTMLPTGADETFEYNYKMDASSIGYPLIYENFQITSKNRGAMFTRCLNYKPCKLQYLGYLKQAKLTAAKIDLKGQVDEISKMLNGTPTWAQIAVKNWIDMKSKDVDKLLKKNGL
jgi:spore coat protein CotH